MIDVQTLLPFDLRGAHRASRCKKTNRVALPRRGRARRRHRLHDAAGARAAGRLSTGSTPPPRTLSAQEHRPAYGSDGDYFSKPNRETVFDAVYEIVSETAPSRFPSLA